MSFEWRGLERGRCSCSEFGGKALFPRARTWTQLGCGGRSKPRGGGGIQAWRSRSSGEVFQESRTIMSRIECWEGSL